MSGRVYLAGPIGTLTFDGANEWRERASEYLEDRGIEALSPLRGKRALVNHGVLGHSGYPALGPLFSDRGITTRDRNDAMTCDVLLVNLLGTSKVSLGTVMEIAWADSIRTPIVCAMLPGNVHDHAMLRECVGFFTGTLNEALEVTCRILNVEP